MGVEIERKFLLKGSDWKKLGKGKLYRQGYLSSDKKRTVRVRTVENKGFLTIKGISRGVSRQEFEYEIPLEDARQMLERLCTQPLIEKHRYTVEYGGFLWEIDEFHGENQGLIIAEIELESEDQDFEKPPWVGAEVSGDPRYFNSSLGKNPYSRWSK